MKTVAIITGTSTGLGESLALKLAAQGTTTYATMRNTSKASDILKSAVAAGNLPILGLDVQCKESVSAAARAQSGESAVSYQTSDEVANVVLDLANPQHMPLRIRTYAWAEEFTAFKT